MLGASAAVAKSVPAAPPWKPAATDAPVPAKPGGYVFFTGQEARFIEAAVARLIPADERGPGAKEAGAATFIDRQLDGRYGAAQSWYMRGPWTQGTKSQGYQSRLTPAQTYRAAIKAIDAHCRAAFGGKSFDALAAEQQDRLLGDLENGRIELPGVKAEAFFDLLLQNTVEGFFSDPLYGGNRDMVGWKLIGFPGAHYNYRDYIGKHNQRLAIEPVSLLGQPDGTSRR
ncbi:MAG: gluconate 2-dehydrogenase subunit 3 family protein [Rhodospirillaceae bacterium]|nr:gluconate 2-dehydrogenase subunit 3 family protein [Rhodospirillaceae bacterium]